VSSLLDSISTMQSKLNLKLNISDTAAMLSSRINRDTASLSRRIDSVKTALTNYLPLTGGILTGPLNGTSATLSGNLKSGAVTYPNTDGTAGFVLTTDGNGAASWAAATGGSGITEVGPISATATPTGAYIASNTLYLAPADADNAGIVSIVSQTFAGEKIFISDLNVNGITVGRGAGSDNGSNTAIGKYVLQNNTTGNNNTANGIYALRNNTTGNNNTANGTSALESNTDGYSNIAIGWAALLSNTTGHSNTANGVLALLSNTTGHSNTANGQKAMYNNTTGSQNTATGYQSLYNNTTGFDNTANGLNALYSNATGYRNTAIGRQALYSNVSGTLNTAIGNDADVASYNLENATAIGNGAKVNRSNQIMLGNASIDTVFTSGKLKLGTITYPNTDSTAGLFLTTDGSGTASWSAPSGGSTHTIGESFGGGIVFYVTTDGLHGLIAETQDQGNSTTWYDAQDRISTSSFHSAAGKLFTDWRLPTRNELNLLYAQKASFTGFQSYYYWSSTEVNGTIAWIIDFDDAEEINWLGKGAGYNVRAIRSF